MRKRFASLLCALVLAFSLAATPAQAATAAPVAAAKACSTPWWAVNGYWYLIWNWTTGCRY